MILVSIVDIVDVVYVNVNVNVDVDVNNNVNVGVNVNVNVNVVVDGAHLVDSGEPLFVYGATCSDIYSLLLKWIDQWTDKLDG